MMLKVSERRQSPRNCQANPSRRRTSSQVGYWCSLFGCGDESDIQKVMLPWIAFSIQSKELAVVGKILVETGPPYAGRRKTTQKNVTPAIIVEIPMNRATIAGRGRSFSAEMIVATAIITSGFITPRAS